MELKHFNSNFNHEGIDVQVNYYGDKINVNASKRNGARSEVLNVSYDKNGVRTPAEVETYPPFDPSFFTALEEVIANVLPLSSTATPAEGQIDPVIEG